MAPKNLDEVPKEKHLLRHSKSAIYYTNFWDRESGETLRKSTRERDSLKNAKQKAAELHKEWLAQLAAKKLSKEEGRVRPKNEMRFEDIAVEILANKAAGPRKKSELSARNQLRHLLRFFRHRRLVTINKTDWDAYVAWCRTPGPVDKNIKPEDVTKDTEMKEITRNLNDDHKYFVMVMRSAYHKGIIPIPYGRDLIALPDEESEVGREITRDEIQKLFKQAEANEVEWHLEETRRRNQGLRGQTFGVPDIRFQMEWALRTGTRKLEMLGMRKDFIDRARCSIKLPPWFTKTKKGREFPVAPDLMAKLLAQGARHPESPYIFPSPKDPQEHMTDNKRAWYRLLKQCDIDARWHDWRHTCATIMARAGINDGTISKLLGMSKKVLARIYAHLNIDDHRPAAMAVQVDFLKLPGGNLP